jgi:hypothetical protein
LIRFATQEEANHPDGELKAFDWSKQAAGQALDQDEDKYAPPEEKVYR